MAALPDDGLLINDAEIDDPPNPEFHGTSALLRLDKIGTEEFLLRRLNPTVPNPFHDQHVQLQPMAFAPEPSGSVLMQADIYSGVHNPLMTGLFRLSADGTNVTEVVEEESNGIDNTTPRSVAAGLSGGFFIPSPVASPSIISFIGHVNDDLLVKQLSDAWHAAEAGNMKKVSDTIASLERVIKHDPNGSDLLVRLKEQVARGDLGALTNLPSPALIVIGRCVYDPANERMLALRARIALTELLHGLRDRGLAGGASGS